MKARVLRIIHHAADVLRSGLLGMAACAQHAYGCYVWEFKLFVGSMLAQSQGFIGLKVPVHGY